MKSPKVSIILPVFNGEKYLRESIESILNQSFSDFELIMVDDCSTDSTLSIMKEYAVCDERLRVIHNEKNMKLPESLNIGFREAKGEFYTWTSDDNIFLRRAVEVMYNYMVSSDCGMVCAGYLLIDEDKHFLREADPYDERIMYTDNVVGACFMYRANIAKKVGEYDRDMFLVEDYDYWLRILNADSTIHHLPECLYLYRMHDRSLTNTQKNRVGRQKVKLYLKYFDWIMHKISNDKCAVSRICNDLLAYDASAYECYKDKLLPYVPELKDEMPIPKDKPLALYGAGEYGKMIFDFLGDNADCFIVTEKNSDYLNQTPVYTLEEALNKGILRDRHIIVAVSSPKIYDIVSILNEKGIKEFSLSGRVLSQIQQ